MHSHNRPMAAAMLAGTAESLHLPRGGHGSGVPVLTLQGLTLLHFFYDLESPVIFNSSKSAWSLQMFLK